MSRVAASDRRLSTAGGFAAILLWSTTVAVARSLSEALGAVSAAAAVYAIGGSVSLLPLLRDPVRRKRMRALPVRYLFGCGGLFVFYMLALFLALGRADDHQQVLEIGLLNYLWPVLTLLLSVWLLRRPAGFVLAPGTLLALVGLFLVMTQGTSVSWSGFVANVRSNPVAYLFGLAAAVSWALYSVLTRLWAEGASAGGVEVFLPATAVVMLALATVVDEPRAWTLRAAAEAVFLGLATAAAYGLWDRAMRRGHVFVVAAGSYLTPLLSTLVSVAYLAVWPGAGLWLGCLLLIAGSVVSGAAVRKSVDAVSSDH